MTGVFKTRIFHVVTRQQTLRGGMISLLFICVILQRAFADPSITCFQDDVKCEMVNDNLISTYVGMTWQECLDLCEEENACLALNLFGQDIATSILTMLASYSPSVKARSPARIVF